VGSYIKSPDDIDICTMLTTRFSDAVIPLAHPAHDPAHPRETFIGQLRRHRASERLFDGNHALERVSHRLAHSLGATPSVPGNYQGHGPVPTTLAPRLRWHWLLNTASVQLPALTSAAICDVLDQVLQRGSTVDLVTFDAQVRATASGLFELHPANSHMPQVVVQGGKNVCLMVLDCPQDQQLPNPAKNQQPDPPPSSGHETPINNVPVPP
jgi:hypothetical protein